MIITTFKRYEIKYLITEEQFRMIKADLQKHMVLDDFCKDSDRYMIYSLYFDTENDDIIRRSLEKPYYKEKLRMRSYTMPICGDDDVFLELKKKVGGIVSKRRVRMTLSQVICFIENGIVPKMDRYKDRQVLAEITDFLNRYPAKAKVLISYERIAYFDKDNPKLRVSFDKNILSGRDNIDFSNENLKGDKLLSEGQVLMEIKCDGHIPLWLCNMLSEKKLYKTNFSKYGTEYQNFFKNNLHIRKFA
jgi:hypothetical protein